MKIRYELFLLLIFNCIIIPQNTKPSEFSIDIISKLELHSSLSVSPIFFENKIYTVETSGFISCYDISGKKIWSHNAPSSIPYKPVISDNMLCTATIKNEIATYNLGKGTQIQSFGIDDSITTDPILLQYSGEKELMIPKATESKSAIVFGTNIGKIYCYDLETLQEYWHNNDAKGMIKTEPIIFGNKLLFTSKDGFLYCIDTREGLLNWRWKEKAETDFSNSKIICDGRKVYVVDNEKSLFSIDLLLGNLTWKASIKVVGSVGLSNDKRKLFVKGLDNKFYFLSAEKGKILKEIKRKEVFEKNFITPIGYKKKILFTENSSIISLDEKYKESTVITVGSNPINTFIQIDKTKFLVSDSNGTIIIFSIR